jgi:predicted nuclease with TOPRIM domain
MGRISTFFSSQHITLAQEQKRQMLSLDSEFENMQTEIQTLKSENLRLQSQVNPLEREVNKLQQQVEKMRAESHSSDKLDDMAEQLLLAVAHAEECFFISDVYSTIGSVAKSNLYIGLLRKKHFIIQSDTYPEAGYKALQAGLEYLSNRNMI